MKDTKGNRGSTASPRLGGVFSPPLRFDPRTAAAIGDALGDLSARGERPVRHGDGGIPGRTAATVCLAILLSLAPLARASESAFGVLPPVATPEGAPLSQTPRLFVSAFAFEGNEVFSDEELAAVFTPYTGRSLSSEELHQVRRLVTAHYVERGYINSGAILPDQDVRDGVVRIQVVEGRLTEVQVTGTERLRPEYVAERLRPRDDEALQVDRLQEGIQILHQGPLIERIDAELLPGPVAGEAVLHARVQEATPYRLDVRVNNYRPPSVGAWQLTLDGVHRNLTGRGDSLGLNYSLTETEQTDNYGLSYRLPLNPRDTTLSLDYQHSNPTVVEEPFEELDVVSLTERIGLGLSHPAFRTAASALTLGLRLDRSRNETYLLGRPYSFSTGPEDGRSVVSALRLSADWLDRDRDQVLAARATLSVGLDLFGATVGDLEPDGQFVALLGQIQWGRRLGEGGQQLILRAAGQWTNDPLLPLERFVVGGVNSVRGYRENRLVRDIGWTASAELRLPLVRDRENRPVLQVAPFTDAGQAWNREGLYDSPETLMSVGAGLLWDPDERVQATLYWGIPLRDLGDDGDDLQDQGIHFQLSAQLL